MHVLTGESALRALRAVRCRGLSVWLAYPPTVECIAYLPGQVPSKDASDDLTPWEDEAFCKVVEAGPTLEDIGFDFPSVESNTRVDYWRLGDMGGFTAKRPLELGVFAPGQRVRRKKSFTRLLPRTLPVDALVRVSPHLFFVCPELVVMHLAAQMSSIQLAKVIMELCGNYALSPNPDESAKAMYGLEPVTTLERIRCYMGRIRVHGGLSRMKMALDMAMEGSASPGETRMALMMSLPTELGGYGFEQPLLNAKIETPEEERDHVSGAVYYPDAFWQEAYADLEYESVDFHLDPLAAESLVTAREGGGQADPEVESMRLVRIRKADADRRRMRELQYLGVQLVPVTSFDLGSVSRMDQVACSLARCHLRAARWYEAHPEDMPPAGGESGDGGQRKRPGRQDVFSRRQYKSACYWESWPDCLDEHTYKEARIALLRSLSEEDGRENPLG